MSHRPHVKTQILGPEDEIQQWLEALLEGNLDCVFAVAYITAKVVTALTPVITRRLSRQRFRLRVVFQDQGFRTDPEAIESLLQLSKVGSGSVEIRWSKSPEFHAKGYSFRHSSTKDPTVILGSANLTGKATGSDSGELGVCLGPSKLSAEADMVIRGFFEDGKRVERSWLDEYTEAFRRHRAASGAARKLEGKWKPVRSKRQASSPNRNLSDEPLYVTNVYRFEKEEIAARDRAIKALEEETGETPRSYIMVWSKAELRDFPLNKNILVLFWRDSDSPDAGLIRVRVMRLRRPPRKSRDPRTGKPVWFIDTVTCRGTLASRSKSQLKADTAALARLDVGWKWLSAAGEAGRSGRRKQKLLAFLKRLNA